MEAACQKNDTPGKRGEQLAQDRAGWTEAEEVMLSKASGIPRGRHCNDVKEFRGLLYTHSVEKHFTKNFYRIPLYYKIDALY